MAKKLNVPSERILQPRAKRIRAIQELYWAMSGQQGITPDAASESNQLADKQYVNDGISTASATFRGTYNSISDLPTTGIDNNDYGYVNTTDAAGNTKYDRYKYVEGTGWVYEYSLSNIEFSIAQWAAINSGATAELIEKLSALPTAQDIEDNEEVVATALVDLQENKANAFDMETAQGDIETLQTTVASLSTDKQNTLVSGTNIKTINGISLLGAGNVDVNMTSITYADLVTLQSNGHLIPGMQYRITDYQTTTVQANTQSAGHQFDIIVVADSESVLNENARAIQHEGDTYFVNSNLNAWELKYTLENKNWSQKSGKLIYTDDELWFTYKDTVDIGSVTYYLWYNANFRPDEGETPGYLATTSETPSVDDGASTVNLDTLTIVSEGYSTIQNVRTETTDGYGTITNMKDEFDNEMGYDFKNIQFKRWKANDGLERDSIHNLYMVGNIDECPINITVDDESDFIWAYTFSSDNTGGEQADTSLSGGVHHNSVVPMSKLNNNVFYGDGTYSNSMGYNCYDNSIGNNFRYNSIGNDVYYNSIGNDVYRNSIGNGCYDNSIGNNFGNNSIGNYFQNNSIGNNVYYNSIGNSFQYNSIGNGCYDNSIGNNVYRNSIGNDCYDNSIGNGCNHLTFSKDYIYYCIVENGNQYITLTSSKSTSSSSPLRNITIAQGYNNTTNSKTITHTTVNDAFKTTYQAEGSKIITG